MKVTIKQIAEMAGVHRSTVDKVLNGRPGVSDEVRQRVQAIINELGYTPNPAGRMLQKQGRTYRIAAILVDVDALAYLKAGIEQGIRQQAGFDISVQYEITAFRDAQAQTDILDRAVKNQVDGIVISPINSDLVRAAMNRAADAGIPVVTTNSDISAARRLCYVGLDGERASRVAGRLMAQFVGGKGKIAVLSSAMDAENNNYFVTIREQGFSNFIALHYPQIEIAAHVESFEDPQITYQMTLALLQAHPDLKGLYIACGGVAEAGRALCASGRSKEVMVLSYEDYPQILELLRNDVIDCTLASELQKQGELPVQIIMDYLVFGKKPACAQMFTEIKILVKESLF